MEAWRQWLLGKQLCPTKKDERTYLTPTGLLMEGVYTQNPRPNSAAIPLAFVRPGIAGAFYVIVAIMWLNTRPPHRKKAVAVGREYGQRVYFGFINNHTQGLTNTLRRLFVSGKRRRSQKSPPDR